MTVPINVTMDDRDFMQFMARFDTNLPQVTTNAIRGAAVRYRNRLRKAIKQRGHYVTGYLYRNIKVKRTGEKDYSVMAPYYLRLLEEGTGPYAGGSKYWPRQSVKLMKAAAKYGIPIEVLSRTIRSRGTKPHPFSFEVLLYTMSEIEEDMNRRMDRFLRTKGVAT